MIKNISAAAILALGVSMFSGCQGTFTIVQEETETYLGKFIDGPVSGVTWTCGTSYGVTDADGVFGECEVGAIVTFSIGNVLLGAVEQTADNIFTPQDIVGVPRTETNNAAVQDMAVLILSLDADGDPDNGVEITPTAIRSLNQQVNTVRSIADIPDVTTVATAVVGNLADTQPDMQVMSEEQASVHLIQSNILITNGTYTAPSDTTGGDTTGAS